MSRNVKGRTRIEKGKINLNEKKEMDESLLEKEEEREETPKVIKVRISELASGNSAPDIKRGESNLY